MNPIRLGAAIFVMAALFLASAPALARPLSPQQAQELIDDLPEEHREQLLATPWIESAVARSETRQGLSREDALSFRIVTDICLSEQAASAGFSLSEEETERAENELQLVRRFALYRYFEGVLDPAPEVLQAVIEKKGWREPPAPVSRVSLIHIDASGATEEQRARLRARAERVAAQATPENFGDLAVLWGDTPSAQQRGYLGTINPQQVGETFGDHLSQTPAGSIRGPFQTPSGWNILWVHNDGPARQEYSEDQLNRMARDSIVHAQVQIALEEDSLGRLLEETGAADDPLLRLQETSLRAGLLAMKYMIAITKETCPEPTEPELRALYRETISSTPRQTQYRAREILVRTDSWTDATDRVGFTARRQSRDVARELRQQAIDGADFSDLAREHSVSATAGTGGDLGWLKPPTDADTDRALASLDPGEISLPIERPDGYQLLFLEEKRPAPALSFERMEGLMRDRYWSARRREVETRLREKCLDSVPPASEERKPPQEASD